jgi:hypothetical protein
MIDERSVDSFFDLQFPLSPVRDFSPLPCSGEDEGEGASIP